MISLIHPSRGRAKKSHDNAMEWMDACGVDVEVILAIDSDDIWRDYFDIYKAYPVESKTNYVRMYMAEHKSLVDATNHAAKESTGDILVYLSDDFKCFDNWGVSLIQEFAKYSGPTLIKVDDCLQRFDTAVLTIPIMNRECYNALGYFFHPGYKSMFVDEHLYWRTRKLGYLQYAPHLKFEHCHVSVGKAQDDETYRRSAANWDQGKALFKQHQAAGFPV